MEKKDRKPWFDSKAPEDIEEQSAQASLKRTAKSTKRNSLASLSAKASRQSPAATSTKAPAAPVHSISRGSKNHLPDKGFVPWVLTESQALGRVTELVRKELKRLTKKNSPKRVHLARIALRHWSALWIVLKQDGWESDSFFKEANKPLADLLVLLGSTRDADIDLELGQKIMVSERLLKKWKAHREKLQEQLSALLKSQDVSKLRKKLKQFANNAPLNVSDAIRQSRSANDNLETHLNIHLDFQERLARKLAANAALPDDYHKLRLALKQWRYILEDIYGAEQNELESAQSKLGELHDCDRIREMLVDSHSETTALANLNQMHRKLLSDVKDIGNSLPFGFRPKIEPIK